MLKEGKESCGIQETGTGAWECPDGGGNQREREGGAPRGPSQEKNHTDLTEMLEQVEGICIPLQKLGGRVSGHRKLRNV